MTSPMRSYSCGSCGAPPGRPCVTGDGSQGRRYHQSRHQQAEKAGEVGIDPNQAKFPLAEETRILELWVDGWYDDEIGKELGVSTRTLRRRTADIYTRLGARTRTQAVAIWLLTQHGMTHQPAPLTREAQPA